MIKQEFLREIFYYRDYYLNFFATLKPDVQLKFNWTFKLIAAVDRVPEKFLKHLKGTSGIYEIRVEVGTDIYRVFCFFDQGKLIIVINGFQKKSQRIPRAEIQQAESIKKQYFNEKKSK